MNNIEFGKKMQELAKFFNKQTGQTLDVSFDEETRYLSSRVYSGKDYPKNRETLLNFIWDKIRDYLLTKKIFLIYIKNGKYGVSCNYIFKCTDGSDINIYDCDDQPTPSLILNGLIGYYSGNKSSCFTISDDEAGIWIFTVENEKLVACYETGMNKKGSKKEIAGTVDDVSREILDCFNNYEVEIENIYQSNSEIKSLCDKLEKLVFKARLDKTPFVIEPMIVNEKIVNSSFCFKDKDGHYFTNLDYLMDDNLACTIPYYFFELFIDYFKSNKTDKIDYWIEQDGIITFSIENDQMTITLDNFKDKRKYIVDGTLNQNANDLIRHFKNYEKEYENAYNVSDKSEFTTTKNLCNELETLLANK